MINQNIIPNFFVNLQYSLHIFKIKELNKWNTDTALIKKTKDFKEIDNDFIEFIKFN